MGNRSEGKSDDDDRRMCGTRTRKKPKVSITILFCYWILIICFWRKHMHTSSLVVRVCLSLLRPIDRCRRPHQLWHHESINHKLSLSMHVCVARKWRRKFRIFVGEQHRSFQLDIPHRIDLVTSVSPGGVYFWWVRANGNKRQTVNLCPHLYVLRSFFSFAIFAHQ